MQGGLGNLIIEALIDRSQERVTGEARIRFEPRRFAVTGVKSPHSLADAKSGVYGEMPELWEGVDVRGYSTIAANRNSI